MKKIFANKKYSGFTWHLIFAGLFIGLSLFFLEFTKGITWYLISASLRTTFGIAILIVSSKLFDEKISEIISFKGIKAALIAGIGFLLFFIYYIVVVASGIGKISGLTAGILLTRIILQQMTTGFYEELNYRFLLIEGVRYTKNTIVHKILFVMVSTVLFGLLHCVTGWNTYTFLQTSAIGFAFAVIFIKSNNILIPMILHFAYDIMANMTNYIEWKHNPIFDNLSAIFEIMLLVMTIISIIIFFIPMKNRNDA